jgi:alkanesulfonate monooxygenase SsuD/methylene tetrahydromethanopterin reductase-like flavin-dependent oxidoreductase (luciferase family)
MWLYDHLYGPVAVDRPSLESWTLATALLSQTQRLRVGHLVLCNQFRHPIVLAKMAATLDQVSGGRLALGVGSGSIEDEHTRTGLPWASLFERSARLEETLEIFRQAFTNQSVSFAGNYFRVRDMPMVPGPVNSWGIPIIVGGAGEKYTLPLVARYADIWNVPAYALGELKHKLAVLRAHCDAIGRDPGTIKLSIEAVMALAPDDASLPRVEQMAERHFGGPDFGLRDGGLVGTPSVIIERLRYFKELGFQQVVLFTHDRASDQTLELLASKVVPEL